ncbi:MAG: diguanylate cyclase [Thermoleophilia bacterium]|jgi:diguanylate cyclase (GGDEF)-like protein
MLKFFALRLSTMRRIFFVMIGFGLTMGIIFPFIVDPFVTWDPERKFFFRLACLAAGFAVGSFCFFLIKVTLYERNRLLASQKAELEMAKERFSSLTYRAIETQNWEVSFEDASIPTCWETKKCKASACPVYGREHIRCWLIAGTYCGGEVQGQFAHKLGNCSKCDVYQEAVQHNPINEIGENFNSLMLAVKEKQDLLEAVNCELKDKYAELELMHQQAREMADTDLLTGLRNHAHFQQHLRWEVSQATQKHKPLSLLMLDLDYFKLINDRHGHQKGDEVLRGVGKLLRKEMHNGYTARYGGEEFVVVLPETKGSGALEVADSLRVGMKTVAHDADLPEGAVAASIGVADMPACASDSDSLISAADSALLFAKRKGRDRVAYFRDLSGSELEEGDIDQLHSRLEGASLQTIRALAEAVDTNDSYSVMEATSLARLATEMAKTMHLEDEKADALVLATRLHDIGKIGVPGYILRKSEKLTPEELLIVQQHPAMGQRILWEARQLSDLITAILYHHERWDGKGYPEQLQGKQIPLMARIVGIMDAYRAMRSDRPYRKAMSEKQAVKELRKGAGTQFDPRLVDLFINLVEAKPEDSDIQQAS